jgi:hypothetical protein
MQGEFWASEHPDSGDEERGFRCDPPSTLSFEFQSDRDCVATFPACDATVADVERCYRARFPPLGGRCPEPVPDVCAPVAGCMWDLREERR